MKDAWLWVLTDTRARAVMTNMKPRLDADLLFSSPTVMIDRGYDSHKHSIKDIVEECSTRFQHSQLVRIRVRDDWDDWDYIPENY